MFFRVVINPTIGIHLSVNYAPLNLKHSKILDATKIDVFGLLYLAASIDVFCGYSGEWGG